MLLPENLKVNSNEHIRCMIRKGPICRLPEVIDFDKLLLHIAETSNGFALKWCKSKRTNPNALSPWRKQQQNKQTNLDS